MKITTHGNSHAAIELELGDSLSVFTKEPTIHLLALPMDGTHACVDRVQGMKPVLYIRTARTGGIVKMIEVTKAEIALEESDAKRQLTGGK